MTLEHHADEISSITFTLDDMSLAATSMDGTVSLLPERDREALWVRRNRYLPVALPNGPRDDRNLVVSLKAVRPRDRSVSQLATSQADVRVCHDPPPALIKPYFPASSNDVRLNCDRKET